MSFTYFCKETACYLVDEATYEISTDYREYQNLLLDVKYSKCLPSERVKKQEQRLMLDLLFT